MYFVDSSISIDMDAFLVPFRLKTVSVKYFQKNIGIKKSLNADKVSPEGQC